MVSPRSHKTNPVSSVFVSLFLVGVVLCSSVLTSCGDAPPPVPTVINRPFRPLIALDVEIDTPPLYSPVLAHQVALAVAQKIDDMTRENTGGMVIFACRISSRSYADCPVNFRISPFPALTMPPPLPKCGSDSYDCSNRKTAYKKALASWYKTHDREVNDLASLRAWVHTQTNNIRSMTFPFDDKGSDIFGALATASENLNLPGMNARKFLLLATDFVSTTTLQSVGSFSLAGISISAIYRTCTDNKTCIASNAYWSSMVRAAGALSFQVYSVEQSQALGLPVDF